MLKLFVLTMIYQLTQLGEAAMPWEAMQPPTANLSKPLYPVILIPGFVGNRLEAKLDRKEAAHFYCQRRTNDWYDLWVGIINLLPYGVDCLEDKKSMRLIYNSTSRKTQNTPGVSIRAANFGKCESVEYLCSIQLPVTSYMRKLVQHLVDIGYERDKSVLAAPYDFRRAVNELEDYFVDLRKLIETAYLENNNRSVIFISHSNGCQNLVYFLSKQTQAWKDKHVRSAIALAGAWAGSVKALLSYTFGLSIGPFLQARAVRRLMSTFSSVAGMLPTKEAFNATDVLIRNGEQNYTLLDYQRLFSDLAQPDAHEMLLDFRGATSSLPIPNVEFHCLHGYDVPTMEQFNWNSGGFPERTPDITSGDGDGTVNIASLRACRKYEHLQTKPFHYKTFAKVQHTPILDDKLVLDYIDSVLFDKFS